MSIFHQTVVAEIRRRREAKSLKLAIIKSFDSELENCLRNLDDYSCHQLPLPFDFRDSKFKEIANELGFRTYKDAPSSLSVPYETTDKLTLAQVKLHHFEKKLAKARKKGETRVFSVCKSIESSINKGACNYIISDTVRKIRVVPKKALKTTFEFSLVYKYFSKLNLCFSYSDDYAWYFTV